MKNLFIENIIHNFKEQLSLCEKMAASAREQLGMLKQTDHVGISAQVMDIMVGRQKLLEDLQALEAEKRDLREQVVSELGISEFNLDELEAKLESDQFTSLREMVNQLGTILRAISEIDDQSQILMREGLNRGNKTEVRADSEQASKAYNQSKELKRK